MQELWRRLTDAGLWTGKCNLRQIGAASLFSLRCFILFCTSCSQGCAVVLLLYTQCLTDAHFQNSSAYRSLLSKIHFLACRKVSKRNSLCAWKASLSTRAVRVGFTTYISKLTCLFFFPSFVLESGFRFRVAAKYVQSQRGAGKVWPQPNALNLLEELPQVLVTCLGQHVHL